MARGECGRCGVAMYVSSTSSFPRCKCKSSGFDWEAWLRSPSVLLAIDHGNPAKTALDAAVGRTVEGLCIPDAMQLGSTTTYRVEGAWKVGELKEALARLLEKGVGRPVDVVTLNSTAGKLEDSRDLPQPGCVEARLPQFKLFK